MEYLLAAALVSAGVALCIREEHRATGTIDLFSPLVFAPLLLWARAVPSLVMMVIDLQGALDPIVLVHTATRANLGSSALLVGVSHFAGLVSFLYGVNWARSRNLVIPLLSPNAALLRASPGVASLSVLVIGLLLLVFYLVRVGGVQVILDLLGSRSALTSGRGYVTTAYTAAFVIAASLAVLWYSQDRVSPRRVLTIAIVSICVIGLNATGGRSDTLLLTLCALLTWHFMVQRLRLRGRWIAVVGVLGAAYVGLVPMIREAEEGIASVTSATPMELAIGAVGTLAKGNGYVGSQMLVVSHFDRLDRLWLGRSALDLLLAPVPRAIHPRKPPVDDGVYLFSIARGIDAKPPTPYRNLTLSSWPLQTFGAGWANFHIFGVIAAFAVLGCGLGAAHSSLSARHLSPLSVIFYGMLLWRFQLSNLGIVTSLIFYVLVNVLGAVSGWLVVQSTSGRGAVQLQSQGPRPPHL